jgi:hypothetical protein
MNLETNDIEQLRRIAKGLWREYNEVCRVLGEALHYPKYPDNETGEICVGDHAAGTIAREAADKIKELSKIIFFQEHKK